MDKFFSLTIEDLHNQFADKSSFYSPLLAFTSPENEVLQEAFFQILPGDQVTFNLREKTTISLTCLNGDSELLFPELPPINLSSSQSSPYFYIRFDSAFGQFVIRNIHKERFIIHVTSENQLTIKFQSCENIPQRQLLECYEEESILSKEGEKIFRLSPAFLTSVGLPQITKLQNQISDSQETQGRICCHPLDSSIVQEMFLSFNRGTTFPIMRHIDKSESLIILNGTLDYRIYSKLGEIIDTVSMSSFQTRTPSNSLPFYIWINRNTYHSPLVTSEILLAKETTSGPFLPKKTQLFNRNK